jgi:hypothetical protein
MKETSGELVAILLDLPPWNGKTVWAVLFIGLPTSALFISWFHFFRNRQFRRLDATAALVVLSGSYAGFLGVLGPLEAFYARHRYQVIGINLAVCWVVVVVSLILVVMGRGKTNGLWDWILISAFILAPLWFFVAVINSAV